MGPDHRGAGLGLKGMSTMARPPFPNPDSQILKLIIASAIGAMQSGTVDAEGAISMRQCMPGTRATSKARTSVRGATSGVGCRSSDTR